MSETVSAVVSGSTVVVDVSLFGVVALAAPWAYGALAAALGSAVATAALSPRRRGVVLFGIPVGCVLALVAVSLAAQRGVQLTAMLSELHDVLRRGDDVVRLCGLAAGIGVVSALAAVTRVAPRRRAVGVAVIGLVAVGVGVVGVVRVHALRASAAAPLIAAMPLPWLQYPGQGEHGGPPITVHVGRTAKLPPERITTLGSQNQPLPAASDAVWQLKSVAATLAPTAPGPAQTTVTARSGPVSVSIPVAYVGVTDMAPVGLTLRPGHRQAWVHVAGRGGVTDAVAQKLAAQKASHLLPDKPPPPDMVLTVRGERDVQGLRVVSVQLDRLGGAQAGRGPELIDVVAKDGVLYRHGGGVLLRPTDEGCDAPLLGFSQCRCSARGVERCVHHDENTVGGLLRMGMALMTLGLSEMSGACDGCDAGHEEGLVLLP